MAGLFDCDDTIDGGTPASVLPDTLDGGTPSSTFTDTVDGGGAFGLCGPISTSIASYTGTLGDGGQGHSVLFHDKHGTPVAEVSCRDVTDITWSRELTEVSRCVLTANAVDTTLLDDLWYWVHHVTVYRDGNMVWTGVIQKVFGDGNKVQITARDYACFVWRTRVQNTRTWTNTDPAVIVSDQFTGVYQWHGLTGSTVTYPTQVAYDVTATKDSQRTDQLLSDLVKLGVDWTIYRGRPVVMPTVRTSALVSPVGFSDCDFSERMTIAKDGNRLCTDLLLKGKNSSSTAVKDLAGLKLQDLVTLDDLFGAANIKTAADQLVTRRSSTRVQVTVPPGASLTPDAPVDVNTLMPGIVFPLWTNIAGGVSAERRLEKVEVSQDASGEKVSVTLGAVPGSLDADVEDGPGI